MRRVIFLGYDRREQAGFTVAAHSIKRYLNEPIPLRGLMLSEAQKRGIYKRPTVRHEGALVDLISVTDDYDGRMSTEHANLRFFVPLIVTWPQTWAMFTDCDVLARDDLSEVFEHLDETKALYCVHHNYEPLQTVKMDGQLQTKYPRKNWSSVMIFNCAHPSNARLTLDLVNSVPGRDLHNFCWLEDHEIGGLDPAWNWLVGHSDPMIDPKLVHFTTGLPDMIGYDRVPFAEEWHRELVMATLRP